MTDLPDLPLPEDIRRRIESGELAVPDELPFDEPEADEPEQAQEALPLDDD